jgi:predicted RNA-binding protein with PIN domain
MPYLVDGDNLLGTWRGRERSGDERRELAHELARHARRIGRRLLTVFDGPDPGGAGLGADVRFAGGGRSADELILSILREQEDVRGWVVVTSDRSLGDRCRHLGARVERCDRFRPRLCEPAGPEKPASEHDVDLWLREFGEGDPTSE